MWLPRCTAPATTFFFAACVSLNKVAQLPRRFPSRTTSLSSQITPIVVGSDNTRFYTTALFGADFTTDSDRSPASVPYSASINEALQGISMAKPLRTDDPAPQNMQFAHFGVLNDGSQSKGSLFTSIALNVLLAFCAVVIGAAAKKTIDNRHKLTELTEPIPIKKAEEPPPPKIKLKIPP